MLNKRKMKSLDLTELVLVLICILLVVGIFNFITDHITINSFLNNAIVVLLLSLTVIFVAITVFQFIKRKYVEATKAEVNVEMQNYQTKVSNKIVEVNTRIGHFEGEYSKKLKKVTKDYLIKAKEIEDIKKELAEKIKGIDRKMAELEVQTSLIKLEKLESEPRKLLCEKILKLNDLYPGICDEETLKKL